MHMYEYEASLLLKNQFFAEILLLIFLKKYLAQKNLPVQLKRNMQNDV